MQKIREQGTLIAQKILFFEIELIHLDEKKASQLLASEELAHFLLAPGGAADKQKRLLKIIEIHVQFQVEE